MSTSFSLTNAVTSGDESAVSALLAGGADVNESTNGGQTALILAVIFGHTNVVRVLMNAGADPQLRDNLGLNAIEWAQRRGLTEAHNILTNKPETATRPKRILIPVEEPTKPLANTTPTPRIDEAKNSVSDEDKSRRWLAGVRQRLDEQAMRRLNRNEPPVEPRFIREEPPSPPPPPIEVKKEAPVVETVETPVEKPRITGAPRILTPPVEAEKKGKRKRCPQCNAIYNGDLVSYCAHHIVALVDADEPIVTEKPKSNAALFWILLVITLTGSVVAGSLITTYVYKSKQAATRSAAEQQKIVQKGTPEVGVELAGKAVSLPEAECPVKGPDPVSGTVVVRIMVDKNGQVYWARGSGGDWLMRGAATEAAMKSTFASDKLRGREVEGTITYTFTP
ncbi:MAG TPA: ankyrin repeat domain-containing protein [Pyrinomonadaceae bacterium]|nr:ankyrin repeat domain-containing protein [Pyrinomonadaceae bacterium]